MENGKTQILDLPQDCISKIISSTNPKTASQIPSTSKLFRSIADSDEVWRPFLPCDHLSQSSSSAKQTYLRLSVAGTLIDGGKKHLSVERATGKKKLLIGARSLYILWGDTPEYWEWVPDPRSRFEHTAVLQWVWWLEIRGRIRTRGLSPGTNYSAYLVFKMAEYRYGFIVPADVSVEVNGEMGRIRSVYLDPDEEERLEEPEAAEMAVNREDGWMEIEMGEFYVGKEDDDKMDREIELLVMENKGLSAKGGLIVEGFEIRPKQIISDHRFNHCSNG